MTQTEWRKSIKASCEALGTYRSSYDSVIETLADIMVQRDEVLKSYNGKPVIEHTNSHGKTNLAKNPALMLWNDLNATALSYWKELGLTPTSFRKMGGAVPKPNKASGLAAALLSIEQGGG